MAYVALILVALLLHAIVDATKLKFSKINGQIYAETDEKHFVMYGPITRTTNGDVMPVAVDEESHFLFDKCDDKWKEIKKIAETTMSKYGKVRDRFLGEKRLPEESPNSYTWSDTFSSDQKVFSVTKLDEQTYAYASPYFPSALARLIISGPVVITFYYDGKVRVKSMSCLFINERILLAGIKKIDSSGKKSLLPFSGDRVLKKHLKNNGFDEDYFELENKSNIKTRTEAEISASQAAVNGGALRSFDGWKS